MNKHNLSLRLMFGSTLGHENVYLFGFFFISILQEMLGKCSIYLMKHF